MGPLEIEVTTDAGWTLYDQVPLFGASKRLADHDVAATKPALLYGDNVTLRSGNPLIVGQQSTYITRTLMPLQAVKLFAGMCVGDTRQLVFDLAGPGASLPSEIEAEQFLSDWRSSSTKVSRLPREQALEGLSDSLCKRA